MAKRGRPRKNKENKETKPKEVVFESIEAKHEFTQDEKIGLLETLAGAHHEVQGLQDQAKTSAQDWKLRIKVVEDRIADISNKATSGYELRKTECSVEYNSKKGKKTYFRVSDNKEIETRDMTPSDFEMLLPLPAETLKKGEPIVSVGAAIEAANAGVVTEEVFD